MPTDEQILGFSNRWYVLAVSESQSVTFTEEVTIRTFTTPPSHGSFKFNKRARSFSSRPSTAWQKKATIGLTISSMS